MSLKRVTIDDKNALLELVRKNPSAIEEGLAIVSDAIGMDTLPLIDLVGVNSKGDALLIFADVVSDDSALLVAAAQTEWFLRNVSLLTRLFPDLRVSPSAPPRAALIYPEFPLLMKKFVRAALPSPSPLLLQYRCLEAGHERYLYLESYDPHQTEPRHPRDDRDGLPPFRSGPAGEAAALTREEREAFLN
jgi:hypothetical protein